MEDPYNIWSFLDDHKIKIWCICLKERNDRFEYVCGEFNRVNLLNKVNFHRPKKNLINGKEGCFLSHYHCISQSLIENKHALVFEDDVAFTKDWKTKLKKFKLFLEKEIKWDIFRLGCILSHINQRSQSSNEIWSSKSYGTHAILYNVNVIEYLLKTPSFKPSIHIDDYLHDNKKIIDYSLINSMCYQKAGLLSDNEWFSFKFLQKFMENKYIYEYLQKINNIQVWYIKWLPIKLQEIFSIWSFLITIGTYINQYTESSR